MTSTTMALADAYANVVVCRFVGTAPDKAVFDSRAALEQRIKELEMDAKNVQVMLEALKDAHAHIDYDLVRERIGNVIASVEAKL